MAGGEETKRITGARPVLVCYGSVGAPADPFL
jgi:hypothetical protein